MKIPTVGSFSMQLNKKECERFRHFYCTNGLSSNAVTLMFKTVALLFVNLKIVYITFVPLLGILASDGQFPFFWKDRVKICKLFCKVLYLVVIKFT